MQELQADPAGAAALSRRIIALLSEGILVRAGCRYGVENRGTVPPLCSSRPCEFCDAGSGELRRKRPGGGCGLRWWPVIENAERARIGRSGSGKIPRGGECGLEAEPCGRGPWG